MRRTAWGAVHTRWCTPSSPPRPTPPAHIRTCGTDRVRGPHPGVATLARTYTAQETPICLDRAAKISAEHRNARRGSAGAGAQITCLSTGSGCPGTRPKHCWRRSRRMPHLAMHETGHARRNLTPVPRVLAKLVPRIQSPAPQHTSLAGIRSAPGSRPEIQGFPGRTCAVQCMGAARQGSAFGRVHCDPVHRCIHSAPAWLWCCETGWCAHSSPEPARPGQARLRRLARDGLGSPVTKPCNVGVERMEFSLGEAVRAAKGEDPLPCAGAD